ncbi:MAG: DUF1648 domain-containing protein [Bacilli bacterium]|nr:DUF1648 domain-containing protein [Clostridia bacterium]MCI9435451.1 DUF1648 domain-containing protein [Bacilli bacterium]
MKKDSMKVLIISVIVCLLPMVLGIILYDKLPEQMPIHFTINNQPDNYAPKNFALFGIPTIMAIVQALCCIFTQKNMKLEEKKPKIIKILQWIIPVITVLVYVIMIEVPLGSTVYVGKSVCLIIGTLFIILGNYIPKMSYDIGINVFHPMPKSEKTFRKITRLMGYFFILIGIILLILIFFV